MDRMDTSYPTVITATTEFLQGQITNLEAIAKEKDEHIQRITQRDYATAANLQGMRDSMHEWTLNALSEDNITEDSANQIAEICGFELTKEVEVEVTVTYNITLQVPYDEDVESIVNDIDFESVSYNSDNITWLSANVDGIDFQQGATKTSPEQVNDKLLTKFHKNHTHGYWFHIHGSESS